MCHSLFFIPFLMAFWVISSLGRFLIELHEPKFLLFLGKCARLRWLDQTYSLLCFESFLYTLHTRLLICDLRIYSPSMYFHSLNNIFIRAKIFLLCWSLIYQYFLLWVTFLASNLRILCLILIMKIFSYVCLLKLYSSLFYT